MIAPGYRSTSEFPIPCCERCQAPIIWLHDGEAVCACEPTRDALLTAATGREFNACQHRAHVCRRPKAVGDE